MIITDEVLVSSDRILPLQAGPEIHRITKKRRIHTGVPASRRSGHKGGTGMERRRK